MASLRYAVVLADSVFACPIAAGSSGSSSDGSSPDDPLDDCSIAVSRRRHHYDRPTPRFLTSPAWIVLLLLGIVFSFAKSSLPVTDNAAETRDDSLIGKGSPS